MFQPSNEENKNTKPLADSITNLKGEMESILNSQKDFLNVLLKVDNVVADINKKFGTGTELSNELRAAITQGYDEIVKMGGSLDAAGKIQQDVTQSLGRNVILQKDSFKELYAASKVTGEEVGTIVSKFKDVGISVYQASENTKKIVDVARSLGVSAQEVSANALRNMDAMNKYNFQGGVEGLAKMAANAASLRIDMQSAFAFAEKVYNPEGAIEAAAALQRLGVAQSELLDPLRLMDLAENDPTELQNQMAQMSKQFVSLKDDGTFEILPGAKRQLREISQAMGISYGELTKMALGSADLDNKLQKIKFPDFATEDQRKLIANLTEMGKGGVYKIKVDGEDMDINAALEKYASDPEKLDKLIEASKPKSLEDLASEQLGTAKRSEALLQSMKERLPLAFAGSKVAGTGLEEVISGYKTIANTFTKATPIGETSKLIDTSINKLSGVLDNFTKSGKISDVLKGLSDVGTDIEKFINTNVKNSAKEFSTTIDSVTKTIDKLSTTFENLGKGLDKTFKDIIPTKKAKDLIITPDETIETLPEDTIIAGTGLDFIKEFSKTPTTPTPVQSLISTPGFNPNDLMKFSNSESTVNKISPTEVTVNFKMSLDVSGTNSSSIDTGKIIEIFNNQDVKEKIVQATKDAMTEKGQRIIYS